MLPSNYGPDSDPAPNLRGKALAAHMVVKSRRWIEECACNGKSYAGPNGRAIMKADLDELRRWEETLRSYG